MVQKWSAERGRNTCLLDSHLLYKCNVHTMVLRSRRCLLIQQMLNSGQNNIVFRLNSKCFNLFSCMVKTGGCTSIGLYSCHVRAHL